MTRFPLFAFIFMIMTTLAACTSTPQRKESACAGIDWWEMGRTDGVAGLELEKGLSEHRHQCAGSAHPIALDLYENGRDAGLVDYCSPQQGLAAGHSGSTYGNVCPTYLEEAFLFQYKIGKRLFDLETEDHELESRIENLMALLAKSNSGTALRAQIDDLRQQRANLDLEIARLEATSLGTPYPNALDPLLETAPSRLPSSTTSSSEKAEPATKSQL